MCVIALLYLFSKLLSTARGAFGRIRQFNSEDSSFAGLAGEMNVSTDIMSELLSERQAQSVAAGHLFGLLAAEKLREDLLLLVAVNANTGVADRHLSECLHRFHGDRDSTAGACVVCGIENQFIENTVQKQRITGNVERRSAQTQTHLMLALHHESGNRMHRPFDAVAHIYRCILLNIPLLNARGNQKSIEKHRRALRSFLHLAERFHLRQRHIAKLLPLQEYIVLFESGQWRSYLVRECSERLPRRIHSLMHLAHAHFLHDEKKKEYSKKNDVHGNVHCGKQCELRLPMAQARGFRYHAICFSLAMDTMHRCALSTVLLVMSISTVPVSFAQTESSFSDVPAAHRAFDAIAFLQSKGILQGYGDGTFRPNQSVNRAEATKIIVSTLMEIEEVEKYNETVYTDISNDAWYKPYVEAARQKLNIIDGPPKATSFNGSRTVNKAEFLKIMLLANGENPQTSYSEFIFPLASDVQHADEWFYPYMRLGIASSMILISPDGMLSPGAQLTRGDVAVMMYHYLMFKQGRRAQALLSEAENEIVNLLQLLEANNIEQAHYASARSLLAARGALASRPDEDVVKAAVKVSEGFRILVSAYQAGAEGRLDDAIQLSSDAWHLAEKARSFSPELDSLATQMQTIAKNMADEARGLKGEQQ